MKVYFDSHFKARVAAVILILSLALGLSSRSAFAQNSDPYFNDLSARLPDTPIALDRPAVVSRSDGQLTLQIETSSGPSIREYVVDNPDLISPDAINVPIYIQAVDQSMTELNGLGVNVLDYSLRSLDAPKFSIARDLPESQRDETYHEAADALRSLKRLLNEDIQPIQFAAAHGGANDLTDWISANAVRDLSQTVDAAFSEALEREDYDAAAMLSLERAELNYEAIQAAAGLNNPVAASMVSFLTGGGFGEKTVYGENNTVSAGRLDRIIGQREHVVGLAHVDSSEPHCTGLFVKPGFVLTAAHCMADALGVPIQADDMKVMFDHVENRQGTDIASGVGIAARAQTPEAGVPALDYVVLSLPQALIPSRTSTPVCLRTRRLRKGQAVYAFGHGRSRPLQYHAAGAVYLPHEIPEGSFGAFLNALGQDEYAAYLAMSYRGLSPTSYEAFAASLTNITLGHLATIMKMAKASYRLDEDNVRRLNFTRDPNLDPDAFLGPAFGVSLDLSGGDSGAPIFFSEGDQCVTGILSRGISDRRTGVRASWFSNEMILPMSVIVADLAAQPDLQDVNAAFEPLIR